MIDTIKLAYPSNDHLYRKFMTHAERVQKISPDGEVLWERSMAQSSLPSHFAGLRIMHQSAADLRALGFNSEGLRSTLQFEFSLQKWQSETSYNNKNTDLLDDLDMLMNWIETLSDAFEYDFDPEQFELYRIDLAQNLILKSGSVDDYLRSLELKMSRHQNGQHKLMRFDGALQYGSRWIGKKIYSKWKEFENVEKKKHRQLYLIEEGIDAKTINGKRALTSDEREELIRMLRVEVEFRRTFLKKQNLTGIPSIPELRSRFEEEKAKFLTVKKLREGVSLSSSEYRAIDLCKRFGYQGAMQEFMKTASRPYWYKIRKQLIAKDIHLDCIMNDEWRLEIDRVDNLMDFELEVA